MKKETREARKSTCKQSPGTTEMEDASDYGLTIQQKCSDAIMHLTLEKGLSTRCGAREKGQQHI